MKLYRSMILKKAVALKELKIHFFYNFFCCEIFYYFLSLRYKKRIINDFTN